MCYADFLPAFTAALSLCTFSLQVRNYGRLLVELAATVPDGLVCFFVSYLYMDQIISKWHDMGVLEEVR